MRRVRAVAGRYNFDLIFFGCPVVTSLQSHDILMVRMIKLKE